MKRISVLISICLAMLLLISTAIFAETGPPEPRPAEVMRAEEDGCTEETTHLKIKNGYPCRVEGGIGYMDITGTITSVEYTKMIDAMLIFDRLGVNHVVIFLNSPGGGLFDGIATAQKIVEEIKRGKTIEIRAYGLIASAASIIMAVGSRGHRYIAPNTIIMIHELQILSWGIYFESVSDKEKAARVCRYLQDNMTDFLLPHIKLSEKEFIALSKEESWGDAKTAIEWGFADELIK